VRGIVSSDVGPEQYKTRMLHGAVESIVKVAVDHGEFDELSDAGRPVDLTAYLGTPEQLRLAFSILKNAGLVPLEMELIREIQALEQEMEETASQYQRCADLARIRDLHLQLSIRMEGTNHRGR